MGVHSKCNKKLQTVVSVVTVENLEFFFSKRADVFLNDVFDVSGF